MRLRLSVAAVAVLCLAAVPSPAAAQEPGRILDEGVFLITRNGAPAGTETFRIVRVGDGTGNLRATARQTVGERRITSSLTTDSTGVPLAYQLNVFDGKTPVVRLQGQGRPGRLSVVSSDGQRNESMREYVVTAGATAIVDDPLVHEFYFLPLLHRTTPVRLIAPWAGRQTNVTVVAGGMENVQVAGHSTTAVHYTVGSGADKRDLWVDNQGRLLRLSVPAQQLTAVRDELP
jgi:hypothetical protein